MIGLLDLISVIKKISIHLTGSHGADSVFGILIYTPKKVNEKNKLELKNH